MQLEPDRWHWRDSMLPARFFIFDARAAIFIVFVVLRMVSLYTWGAFFLALVFFYILERLGLTFEAALRRMRSLLTGKKRPAYIWTSTRRMIDMGANPLS